MGKSIGVFSWRRANGRTLVALSMAMALAGKGQRVAVLHQNETAEDLLSMLSVVDADIIMRTHSIAHYFWGLASLEEVAIQVRLHSQLLPFFIIPAGLVRWLPPIPRVSKALFDPRDKRPAVFAPELIQDIIDGLKLDVLIVDAQSGITEEVLGFMAKVDDVIIVVRFDAQDFVGAPFVIEVANRLEKPISLILNQTCEEITPSAPIMAFGGLQYKVVLPYVVGGDVGLLAELFQGAVMPIVEA
jgi:MinD-like ATPase involved in chromosome partitioning or flagellar assembly